LQTQAHGGGGLGRQHGATGLQHGGVGLQHTGGLQRGGFGLQQTGTGLGCFSQHGFLQHGLEHDRALQQGLVQITLHPATHDTTWTGRKQYR